jgi:hypothetical protein
MTTAEKPLKRCPTVIEAICLITRMSQMDGVLLRRWALESPVSRSERRDRLAVAGAALIFQYVPECWKGDRFAREIDMDRDRAEALCRALLQFLLTAPDADEQIASVEKLFKKHETANTAALPVTPIPCC